jgi:hypothetical protein
MAGGLVRISVNHQKLPYIFNAIGGGYLRHTQKIARQRFGRARRAGMIK